MGDITTLGCRHLLSKRPQQIDKIWVTLDTFIPLQSPVCNIISPAAFGDAGPYKGSGTGQIATRRSIKGSGLSGGPNTAQHCRLHTLSKYTCDILNVQALNNFGNPGKKDVGRRRQGARRADDEGGPASDEVNFHWHDCQRPVALALSDGNRSVGNDYNNKHPRPCSALVSGPGRLCQLLTGGLGTLRRQPCSRVWAWTIVSTTDRWPWHSPTETGQLATITIINTLDLAVLSCLGLDDCHSPTATGQLATITIINTLDLAVLSCLGLNDFGNDYNNKHPRPCSALVSGLDDCVNYRPVVLALSYETATGQLATVTIINTLDLAVLSRLVLDDYVKVSVEWLKRLIIIKNRSTGVSKDPTIRSARVTTQTDRARQTAL
ncbi:hypothetical protein J6590_005576 [Homalodisca vitripennis]|nr:hypothetical protein J6590_005576 [Homalodisca vitripennis]